MTVESLPLAFAPSSAADGALDRVDPAYRGVLRIRIALAAVPLSIAAIALDAVLLGGTTFRWLPTVLAALLAMLGIVVVPARKYRHVGYTLSERTIRIVRGFLFHVDTVVPLIRVQHIDVARGPIERMNGVASLVIHTAGTHNSIVVLPGLAPATAEAIRDRIRSRIRTDFE